MIQGNINLPKLFNSKIYGFHFYREVCIAYPLWRVEDIFTIMHRQRLASFRWTVKFFERWKNKSLLKWLRKSERFESVQRTKHHLIQIKMATFLTSCLSHQLNLSTFGDDETWILYKFYKKAQNLHNSNSTPRGISKQFSWLQLKL